MQPQQKPESKNYLNLLIAFALGGLWAFFWAVDQMVAYILFGAASFFIVLFFYNRKVENDYRTKDEKARPRPSESYKTTATQQRPFTATDQSHKVKQILQIFGVVTGGVIGFSVLYGIMSTSDSELGIDAYSLYNKGEQSYTAGAYDSAYYFYRQALSKDPEMEEAWLGLGNTMHMQNRFDSSLLSYQKAVEINPTYSQARYNVGWWYYNQHNYPEAVRKTKELTTDEPENTSALQLLGDSYYEQKQYDSALTWYEGAYGTGGRSRWLCHVMAYLYDNKNDTEKAISLYKEALEYDPSIVDIYVRLGELLPGKEGDPYRFKAAELKVNPSN